MARYLDPELHELVSTQKDEIERLRIQVKNLRHALDSSVNLNTELKAEIERLRAHIAEIEKWKDEGERIIGPAAEWGPGGNVMVQSSVIFKLGAWWADRPWR